MICVEEGVAYRVLTQDWGGIRKPVAYLSKLLDLVIRGWPTCLQAVAAAVALIEEGFKFTFGVKIRVHTLHDMKTTLSQKASHWLSDSRILKYELVLMGTENLELNTAKVQNPAQFLYGEPAGDLEHHCLEIIDLQTKVREDLQEQPLPYGERIFVDGSSRVIAGKWALGYAIVDSKHAGPGKRKITRKMVCPMLRGLRIEKRT